MCVKCESGFPARFETARKFTVADEREKFLCGPESDGGGSGARAFETDFAEVELSGTEIGIGRFVLVETSCGGILEKDTAATVGLETVFVRIDDDGVDIGDLRECRVGVDVKIGSELEVAAVSRVSVNAERIFFLERENFRERVDRTGGGGAHGADDCADVAEFEARLESVEIHAAKVVARDRFEIELEHCADALVCVVRLF